MSGSHALKRRAVCFHRPAYTYKKNYPIETGKIMREKYESGLIRNEDEFKEVLNNVLSNSERS